MIRTLVFLIFICISVFSAPVMAADSGSIRSITVAGITDKSPLEYNTATGPAGAYIDIWKLWSEKTGVSVNYIITERDKVERSLSEGSIDVIMGYDSQSASAKKVTIIPDIYRWNIYIYRNKKISPVENFRDLRPYKTGITARDAMAIGELSYDKSLVLRGTVPELIDLCRSGEINVFLAEETQTNYILAKRGEWKNLVQSSEPVLNFGVSAAVNEKNRALPEIIKSGFSRISENERLVIEKTWSGGNFKYRIPWGYIGTVIVILTVIGGMAVIWWWNFQLQKKVDEATSELKIMKEEAEAANLAKSRFLDNISHELRTPLTLILAPVEEAVNGKPLTAEILEMIRRNSRNLLSLINDLLDLSRITAGKMKLNVSETDLGEMIKIYCAEMESVAEYNGLTLRYSVPEEPVTAYIDRGKFSSVISNFFSNSLKFTGDGGIINIAVERDRGDAVLRFADTGPGIPPDKTDTIFDRFSQAEVTVSRSQEGTGIGLSIVKEIAELHGGRVSIISRYIKDYPDDHGTEFSVIIPGGKEHFSGRDDVNLIQSPDNNIDIQHIRGVIKTTVEHPDSAKHSKINEEDKNSVLIVEDNTDMRIFLEGLLKSDYIVFTSSNGEEALEILNSNDEIELIISDMMMPVMDGHELLSRINSDEKLSGIPFLFLTARNDDLVKHRGLDLGAVDYVIKPFNPSELLLRVRNQIQLSVMRKNLQRSNTELYAKLKNSMKPEERKPAATDDMKQKMDSVCSFIKEHFRNDLNRDIIASTIEMNPDIFSRHFNQCTGHTLPDYINNLRVEDAKKLLLETDKTVSRVAIETGFENLRTFNRVFKKFTGISPSEFRDGKKQS